MAKWYVEFRDHLQRRRRLPASRDKKASEEFGRKTESLVACRVSGERPQGDLARWLESLPAALSDRLVSLGILDSGRAAGTKPLAEHLEDWRAALEAKGNTEQHVKLTTARARALVEGCGFRYFSDITPARVQQHLADMRDGGSGISTQTSNYYLASLKHFCRWMVREGRRDESRIAHLRGLNAPTDVRHGRRALTLDETQRLLEATRQGQTVRGMTGAGRAMLYQLALERGLRWSELKSLTRASFDLDGDIPTVTVGAAYSKHRRDDMLPLRPATAAALSEYFGAMLPMAEAFPMPQEAVGAKILRVDLEAAGIPYEDDSGRVADCHAFRHTFITNLANSGVHPSVAQHLARHSDVNLTLSRYTHSALDRQSDAVASLPNISAQPQATRATGTDGKAVLGSCLATQSLPRPTNQDQSRQCGGGDDTSKSLGKPVETQVRGASDKAEGVVPPRGIEPRTHGLRIRCSGP